MDVEDTFKGTGTGFLIGLGLAALAPVVLARMTGTRSAAKALVGAYMDIAEKLQEAGGETYEQFCDLVAEVQAERSAAHSDEGAGTADSANSVT